MLTPRLGLAWFAVHIAEGHRRWYSDMALEFHGRSPLSATAARDAIDSSASSFDATGSSAKGPTRCPGTAGTAIDRAESADAHIGV